MCSWHDLGASDTEWYATDRYVIPFTCVLVLRRTYDVVPRVFYSIETLFFCLTFDQGVEQAKKANARTSWQASSIHYIVGSVRSHGPPSTDRLESGRRFGKRAVGIAVGLVWWVFSPRDWAGNGESDREDRSRRIRGRR